MHDTSNASVHPPRECLPAVVAETNPWTTPEIAVALPTSRSSVRMGRNTLGSEMANGAAVERSMEMNLDSVVVPA